MCLPMMAGAQNIGMEELVQTSKKGDPMLGTKDRVVWRSEHAQIDEGKYGPIITLNHDGHVFVKGDTRLGLYTIQDSLMGMATILLNAKPSSDGQHFFIQGAMFSMDSIPNGEYSDDKFYVKKAWRLRTRDAIQWAQYNDGYIRIVTPTYGDYLYDIKLKFYKDE